MALLVIISPCIDHSSTFYACEMCFGFLFHEKGENSDKDATVRPIMRAVAHAPRNQTQEVESQDREGRKMKSEKKKI